MNEHEKEQAYNAQKKLMLKKYDANIQSLNKYYNGMETFICFDVLCANARACARGEQASVWPGGGSVNMPELIEDVKILDKYTIWR